MNTYLLYDPALNGAYTQLILTQQYPMHKSLFAGTKDEGLDDVAPYIFQIDDQFGQKVVQKPIIELKAVVFVQAAGTIETVAAHFRPFIYQKLKGREYFFRFWDARVLFKFLPTCDKEQIKTFFEDLDSLTIADETNPESAIRYSHDHGRLQLTKVSLSTVFGDNTAGVPQAVITSPLTEDESAKPAPKKPRTFLS